MQAHISSHKMKGDRIPCGDSRESHSPPALLDRGLHIDVPCQCCKDIETGVNEHGLNS